MKGFQLEQVRDVLADAFNKQSFDELLLFSCQIKRANVVDDGPLNTVVLNVLKLAAEEGWDALLIAEAAKRRGNRPDVQALAKKYAASLISEFRTAAGGNAYVLKAYHEFQLAPPGFPKQNELGALEKTINANNPMFSMSEWVARAAKIEGRVCRIEINGQSIGTGFLVGPDTVLTNHHVMESAILNPTLLQTARARFDYKQLSGGKILSGTLVEITEILDYCPCTPGEKAGAPEAEDPTADQLDYALIRLKGKPGAEPTLVPDAVAAGPVRGWIPVPEMPTPGADPYAKDAPILIAQHPMGEPLRLAIEWTSVLAVNAARNRVKHRTNTLVGSSGSPTFDRNWNLIALHHYGDPNSVTKPQFNQGIPIAAIRARLAAKGLASKFGGENE